MWVKEWDDIVGHKNIVKYLKTRIDSDSVPDVILLYGDSGIGKSSIAKLLAIEVTTKYVAPELSDNYKKEIIDNNRSTDSIKLFNMSEIQEKEEEIQKVKAEMTVGFSTTKRKVLILDEAHNMSKKAQDSILTELEHLQKGVYVFVCTTEVGALRQALLSRCKLQLQLHNLSDVEAKTLARSAISSRRLDFSLNREMAVALVCNWAQNQPRKIINLLDNFTEGCVVSVKDLEVFINVSTASSVIEVLKYLYGSLTLGIEYVGSMKYDECFVDMLIEVCKVALGHTSSSISVNDAQYIREFMEGKDTTNILQFTADVAGLYDLRKRKIVSAFIKAHVSYQKGRRPSESVNTRAMDIRTMTENIEVKTVSMEQNDVQRVQSLEQMFNSAVTLE